MSLGSADIKMGGDAFVLEPTKEQYKAIVGGKDNQMELVNKLVSSPSLWPSLALSLSVTHTHTHTHSLRWKP